MEKQNQYVYFKISKLQATLVTYIFRACFFHHFITSFHLENKKKPSDRLRINAHRITRYSTKPKEENFKEVEVSVSLRPRLGCGDHWKYCHRVVGTEVNSTAWGENVRFVSRKANLKKTALRISAIENSFPEFDGKGKGVG